LSTSARSPQRGDHLGANPLAYGTMKLWNASTGTLLHDFPESSRYRNVRSFSPDGGFLSIHVDEEGLALFDTRTWKSKTQFSNIDGLSAFSADSSTFAYETYEGSIVLIDPATGGELARIADPDGARCSDHLQPGRNTTDRRPVRSATRSGLESSRRSQTTC
jgi:hypothetical protein